MRLASRDVAAPFVHDVLARDGAVWVHERSDSMAPLLRAGDRLCLTPIAPADVRPGQIVACRRGHELVVHRVLACAGDRLVTKGDGLSYRDAPAPVSDVVGRVTVVETAQERRIDVDGVVWRVLERALALLSRASERTNGESLVWKSTRLPAHVTAWCAR